MISEPTNTLLAAAGPDQLPGEPLRVMAGDPCHIDADTVWFPTTAVLRAGIGPGSVFGGWEDHRGAIGFLSPSVGAVAVNWTVEAAGQVVAVPRVFVNALMMRAPRFSEAVLNWMARSRDDALALAARHIELGALQKVAALLDDLARIHGEDEALFVTQTQVAGLTGLQRTTICNVMVRMKTLGLIRYSRARIRIIDRDALRDISEGASPERHETVLPASRLHWAN